MSTVKYEKHPLVDENFPLRFHLDWNTENRLYGFGLHWHEHIEILYFTNGAGTVMVNNTAIEAEAGDTIVISSNVMHSMPIKPMDCTYHCLIIDKLFCDNFFIHTHDFNFEALVKDKRIAALLLSIADEIKAEREFYKEQIKAYTAQLLMLLVRGFSSKNTIELDGENSQKITLIKKVIEYITLHYKEQITIDEIASYSGFNKYYLCHAFKEVTTQTIFDYINGRRCNHAKKQLMSGLLNISESAVDSGFNNLSYFTKTYKKHMGVLPSQDAKNSRL